VRVAVVVSDIRFILSIFSLFRGPSTSMKGLQ
jgi:hypothetical protein